MNLGHCRASLLSWVLRCLLAETRTVGDHPFLQSKLQTEFFLVFFSFLFPCSFKGCRAERFLIFSVRCEKSLTCSVISHRPQIESGKSKAKVSLFRHGKMGLRCSEQFPTIGYPFAQSPALVALYPAYD